MAPRRPDARSSIITSSNASSDSLQPVATLPGAGRTVVCTIVSANYLARARVLMDSLRRVHPDWDQHVLVVDEIEGRFDPATEAFDVSEVADLPIPNARQLFFRYTILELNTAVKAPLLGWLFREKGYERVVYLDPDIAVYAPMREVEEAFDAGALMCLTPHFTGITRDDKRPTELEILVAGTYNLGFIALARHPQLFEFLDWWWEKMEFQCIVDFAAGLFVDQKWVDLAPGIFDDVHIIRAEGYNVAYWNLGHRRVWHGSEGWRVNDDPLVFFHYSGLDPLDPSFFSKHQNRFTFRKLGEEKALVREYCEATKAAGHAECRGWQYALDRFDDGERIVDEIRALYRRDEQVQRDGGADPFGLGHGYFNEPVGSASTRPTLTRLLYAIWESRPDLQRNFPDPLGAHRNDLAFWFVETISRDHALPDAYVRPVRDSFRDAPRAGRLRRFVALRRLAVRLKPLGRWLDPETKEWIRARIFSSSPERSLTRSAARRVVLALKPLGRWLPVSVKERVRSRLGLPAPPSALPGGFEAAAAAPSARSGSRVRDLSGFHPMDPHDQATGEAWMGARAEVRVRGDAQGELWVLGEHKAEHFRKATGRPDLRLRVAVDGAPVGEILLKEEGRFEEKLALPELPASCLLTLDASATFVPSEIELGEDDRKLAVRLARIGIGARTLVDFAAEDGPYVGEPLRAEALGVNVVGYLRSELGVGESGRLFAAAADAAGLPVRLVNFEAGCSSRQGDDRFEDRLTTANPHPVNVIHINADQMPVAYEHLGEDFFANHYNVGVWHWELPEFPDEWRGAFDLVDELWAPTRFIQDALAAKSPVPVVHMPHAVTFERPDGPDRARFGLPPEDFLFLSMYDMHSFQERKNPEAVISAFERAFGETGRSGVGLVLKVMNAKSAPADDARLRERLQGMAGVHLIDETLSRQDVYLLEASCDAFVSLHRSEGFGLGLAESMRLGKPVIGTGWSGNTDFMDEHNACCVDYRLVELERDHGPYRRGQRWAEPDLDHAAHFMRRLVEDADFRERVAAAGRETLETAHSPEAVGARISARLREISRYL